MYFFLNCTLITLKPRSIGPCTLSAGRHGPSASRSVAPHVSVTEAEFPDIRMDLPDSERAAGPDGAV